MLTEYNYVGRLLKLFYRDYFGKKLKEQQNF